MDLDFDKIVKNPWAAGAFGSVVALKFAPGISWWERAFNVLCGSLCAGFFGPALIEFFAVNRHGLEAAISFGVGMFGLSMAAALMQAIRELKLAEILTSRLTRKG
jgi:hypothetical protein